MIPHHTVEGPTDAPAVVFSGSLGTMLDMWRPQVAALADRFRVVRYDTRGHGGTPAGDEPFGIGDLADDIARLLDHLSIERAHLVGLSLGGAIAIEFGARHPHRAGRLALLCTAATIATPDYWAERVDAVRERGMAALAEPAMQRWFTDRFRAAHPDVVAEFRENFAACDPSGYVACCETLARLDLHDRLAKLRSPALALYGAEDTLTTATDAAILQRGIPDCEVVPIAAAKHLASAEQARTVNKLLTDFLAK
ncbi:MAG TPA: 3-oxoadipate enol-lactonase [Glycomyces sp.]|nr:3-oxoadipate enol-lactonase [Glycomyces sp.]